MYLKVNVFFFEYKKMNLSFNLIIFTFNIVNLKQNDYIELTFDAIADIVTRHVLTQQL